MGRITTGHKVLGAVGGIVGLIIAAIVVYLVFPTTTNQGYAPTQPIPFSHKIHAGQYKMECRYCHVGVTQSRHATIPSLNICMNCHSVVKVDSPWIQLIQKHYRENKPIEWVRVHELPDFVSFNHRPHIAQGISCETCHGDVRNMTKMVQSKELSMGWCLKCHRGENTPKEVFEKFHPGMEHKKGRNVAPINCSTCHY